MFGSYPSWHGVLCSGMYQRIAGVPVQLKLLFSRRWLYTRLRVTCDMWSIWSYSKQKQIDCNRSYAREQRSTGCARTIRTHHRLTASRQVPPKLSLHKRRHLISSYSLICGVTLTWHRRHSGSMFLDGGTWHGMGAHDWYVRLRACSVGMQRDAAGYTGAR